MTVPTSNRFDSVLSAGGSTGGAGLVPFVTNFAPSGSNIQGPNGPFKVGQVWINSLADSAYVLTSISSYLGHLTATWTPSAGSTSGVTSLAGTANEITASGSTGAVTLSIPADFQPPGTVTSAGAITAATGGISAPSGSFFALGSLNLTGGASKINISAASPASGSVGFFTLTGASTFTLTSSSITANSLIFLTLKTLGTVTAASTITYIPTSGAAVLTISQNTDTSTYGYLIIN